MPLVYARELISEYCIFFNTSSQIKSLYHVLFSFWTKHLWMFTVYSSKDNNSPDKATESGGGRGTASTREKSEAIATNTLNESSIATNSDLSNQSGAVSENGKHSRGN